MDKVLEKLHLSYHKKLEKAKNTEEKRSRAKQFTSIEKLVKRINTIERDQSSEENHGGQAYSKQTLGRLSVIAAIKHGCTSIAEIVSLIPVGKSTFYNHKLEALDDIKDAVESNKIVTKISLRQRWLESDNATTQIALYKLVADDNERRKLSMNHHDHTTRGEAIEQSPLVPLGKAKTETLEELLKLIENEKNELT